MGNDERYPFLNAWKVMGNPLHKIREEFLKVVAPGAPDRVVMHDDAFFVYNPDTLALKKIRDLTDEDREILVAMRALFAFFTKHPPKSNTRGNVV